MVFIGTNKSGLTLDSDGLRGIHDGAAEVGDLVDELQGEGLLAGPDFAVGYGANVLRFDSASVSDSVDEL